MNTLSDTKQSLLAELRQRVEDKILEPSNATLLEKLITNADDGDEAQAIAALGTTYKKTGFHFDVRLEEPRRTDTIKYFKKNEALSFGQAAEGEPVHKLIIGDNYDALQNLLIQYRGKIDVIYIDPPYGKDNMGEFAKTNYHNAISRDNLLSMLYFRLQLAKQLLSEDGVIFCSIDDKNQAYVKCLFDEVFNESNFVTNVIWQKKFSPQNDSKWFSDNHDFILCYAKNKQLWHPALLKRSLGTNARYTNPDDDPRGPWASTDLAVKTYSKEYDYPITTPSGRIVWPAKGRCWMTSKEKMAKLIDDKRVWFGKNGNNIPRFKTFLSEVQQGIVPLTVWLHTEVGHNQSAKQELKEVFTETSQPFDTPKPVLLIKRILELSSNNKSSIVLDFFAGSGTTGHAVLELNRLDEGQRTFILCQLNEKTDTTPNGIAYDVTAKRLKRIMTGECYDGNKNFKWAEENEPYGGKLEVYEIAEVNNANAILGQTPFDVIDETLYGKVKFATTKEKIDWVCSNFEHTQMDVEHKF